MDAWADHNDSPGGADSGNIAKRTDLYAITPKLVATMTAQREAEQKQAMQMFGTPITEAPIYAYLLGPQDVLRITVWNHPELTNPSGTANELSGRIINADGTFFYPYIGNVQAGGRTVQEVRATLEKGLSGILKTPQVDVSVLQYRSQRVFVSGEVRNPGAVPITDVPVTIADAIAQTGGLGPEADLSNVTVTRGGKTFTIDLYSLFYEGQVGRNTRLQNGDILNIPERRFNKVFVMGEMLKPGSLQIPRGRFSLAEAMSDAGGINPLSANAGQIYVIRLGANDRIQVFHLNAEQADAMIVADRFDMRPRDVVFVDAVRVVRFARVVNNILPALDLMRVYADDFTKSLPR
jgi:polysaccharide export outer membrane protein